MTRLALIRNLAAGSVMSLAAPLVAVSAQAASPPSSSLASDSQAPTAKPAEKCIAAVRSFTADMTRRGYWIGGSAYGFGYPMGGYGYGYGYGTMASGLASGYATSRPGYEVRTLIASANILGQTGQEQSCQEVLASARKVYTRYAADLHSRGVPTADQAGWRQRQIAAAEPVTGKDISFRSDQLLDADVVSPNDEALGSVHDLVTDPQTGKIAYVVLSRGGLFGIGASYTPVPWADFKATFNGSLLVLDTTKAVVAAAPQGDDDQFTKAGLFAAESQKVDSYWTSHVKLASALN